MAKLPIPLLSVDTKRIYDRLSKAEVGEVVPYEELTELIGRNVCAEARYCVDSARRMLRNQDGIIVKPVHGVGVKRLTDLEKALLGPAALHSIRGKARRAMREITCVDDFSALPPDAQVKHNASLSVLGAIQHFSGSRKLAAIEGKVAEAKAALPVQKTLEFFGKTANEVEIND